eukprot:s3094_g2.t1
MSAPPLSNVGASRAMVAAAALGGFLACEALHRWRSRGQEEAKPQRSPDEEGYQLQLPRAATAKKAMLKSLQTETRLGQPKHLKQRLNFPNGRLV